MPTPYNSEEEKRQLRKLGEYYNRGMDDGDETPLGTPVDDRGRVSGEPSAMTAPDTGDPSDIAAPVAESSSANPVGGPYAGMRERIRTLDEMANYWQKRRDEVPQESEEQRKAREKRERARSVVSGISDFGRALANLIYTNRYAPNQEIKEGMSEKYQKWYDDAKAERDKNRTLIDHYQQKKDAAEGERAGIAMQMEKMRQADAQAAAAAAAEAQRHNERMALEREKMGRAAEEKAKDRALKKEELENKAKADAQENARKWHEIGQKDEKNSTRFVTSRYGEVVIPNDTWKDPVNVSEVFYSTPIAWTWKDKDGKEQRVDRPEIKVDPVTKKPTAESEKLMKDWIGRSLRNRYEATEEALYNLERGRKGKKKNPIGGQTSAGAKKKNPMH